MRPCSSKFLNSSRSRTRSLAPSPSSSSSTSRAGAGIGYILYRVPPIYLAAPLIAWPFSDLAHRLPSTNTTAAPSSSPSRTPLFFLRPQQALFLEQRAAQSNAEVKKLTAAAESCAQILHPQAIGQPPARACVEPRHQEAHRRGDRERRRARTSEPTKGYRRPRPY